MFIDINKEKKKTRYKSKKEGKYQESIQSSTTPDPGYQGEYFHNYTSQTRA